MKVWILASLTLIASEVFCAAEDNKVRYRCQVFKLSGTFEGKTSLEKEIWGGDAKRWDDWRERIKDEVTLFDKGNFRLGRNRLRIDEKGCRWNDEALTFEDGHKVKLPEEYVSMIYSPNILREQGELVRLKIESGQPFEYMERTESGLYELKEVKLPVGMDIEIKAARDGKKHFLVSYLELELRTVNRRAKIDGTRLPVGRPEVDEAEYKLKLRLREQKSYGILLRPKKSRSAVIIRIEIDDR